MSRDPKYPQMPPPKPPQKSPVGITICPTIRLPILLVWQTRNILPPNRPVAGWQFHAKHCGKKLFSLIFSGKMPTDHWTVAVYQYTITSCVQDLSKLPATHPGLPLVALPRSGPSRPGMQPLEAGTLSFTLTPCLFRSPSAHPLCFPRLFRVHPARRRQGPIWRVYLQGLTRFRMISIRSRWRSSPRVFREAGV